MYADAIGVLLAAGKKGGNLEEVEVVVEEVEVSELETESEEEVEVEEQVVDY